MADYTGYEYQELVDRMTTLLSEKEGWGGAYQSSMGQTLIQLMADATDILHYMQERRTRESYLPTASIRSSILARASERGYRPRRNVSSRGTVKIRLVDDDGNTITPEGNVFLPRYTRITFGENNFVSNEDVLITPTDTEVEFEVIEGIAVQDTYDPNDETTFFGQTGYILIANSDSVENSSIYIKDSTDSEWLDIRKSYNDKPALGSLSFASPTSKFYDIKISVDGMRIIFGNDTFGAKPFNTLTVEWVESSGSLINVQATGLEFTLDSTTLVDDVNVTPPNEYSYEIVNTTPIRGGLDAETVSDIRLKAPEYFKSSGRAVTPTDYDFWLVRSGAGGVIDVNTYGEQELGVTIYDMNHIFASYLTIDGQRLSIDEETSLREYIDAYKVALPHVTLIPADQIHCQYNLAIKKSRELIVSETEVFDYVKEQIANLFTFQEGSIGKPFYNSELVRFLQQLTIVKDDLEQNIADYISLDTNPVYIYETPFVDVSFDATIQAGTVGDVYTLTLDGADYSYTMQTADTSTDIINGLVSVIGPDYATSIASDVLTVSSTDGETTLTVSNSGSTVTDNIMIIHEIQVPPRLLNNRYDVDLIVKGSLTITDAEGNVLLSDDGAGNLGSNGTINYVTAKLNVPLLPDGEYYIRYQEDDFSNIRPNERSVVNILNPKDSYSDSVETLSTITFV
jgi:hypothetical protein